MEDRAGGWAEERERCNCVGVEAAAEDRAGGWTEERGGCNSVGVKAPRGLLSTTTLVVVPLYLSMISSSSSPWTNTALTEVPAALVLGLIPTSFGATDSDTTLGLLPERSIFWRSLAMESVLITTGYMLSWSIRAEWVFHCCWN